jgi:hypothetical protein
MNKGNIRYLRRIGQTISFNFVVDGLPVTHVSDTGHSILFYDMNQRRVQGGFRQLSRARTPLQQHR